MLLLLITLWWLAVVEVALEPLLPEHLVVVAGPVDLELGLALL
jgi:hypothetical protein